MIRTARLAFMLCALAAVCLLAVYLPQHAPADARNQSTQPPGTRHTPAPGATLFPGLNEHAITSITVATPDRSFHFLCENPQLVSVNGRQADSEVFSTLLEQISELPVEHYNSFNPQAQNLILTLVISTGQEKQTARFYEDGRQGEKAHIVLGSEDAPEYRQTGGWRVGALMLTCEGTRIQDAHGNEMPANP